MNASTAEPTVYIIDDDNGVRKSFKGLVESVGLRAEIFNNAEAFLTCFEPSNHGCLFVDVRMPGMGGLRLLEHLGSKENHIPVIVCSGYADVSMTVEAFRNGAFDFLEKTASRQKIIHCIQDAFELDKERLENDTLRSTIEESLSKLTTREREILNRVIEGESTKYIALDLCISYRTVEKHRQQIMEKMCVRSVAKLIHTIVQYQRLGNTKYLAQKKGTKYLRRIDDISCRIQLLHD